MTAILTALQHQGPSRATYHIMLPPSYSDHDPLPPPSFDPLSMILSQYPIVTRFVKFITTGDLIQLSRTSSTIRETLLQSPEYWNELLSRTTLVCSETTHIKGDNVKSCVICSMPVCETCIVKSDFHGTSGTFSNRIRTFCDSCWSATDFSHPPNSPRSSAPPLCVCVAKDGWLCSHCRSTERDELRENKYTCATDGCSQLHNTSEKQRVCTWCRLPLPPAWRPVTAEQIPIPESVGGNGNNAPEDDAPGYEEGSGSIGGRRISDVLDSPVDKVRIAGWDQMTEEERQKYQTAWLAKGARERERGGVVRKSEPGMSDGAPGFEDIGNEETGEASGSANVETGEASGSGGAGVEITEGANGATGTEEAVGKLKLKDVDHSGGSS